MIRKLIFLVCLFICRTTDAQFSWDVVYGGVADGDSCYFENISCSGPHCSAVGYVTDSTWHPRIWNSSDWGQTWSMLDYEMPSSAKQAFRHVSRIDQSNIFITADSGIAIRSSDGGLNWTPLSVPGSNTHFSDPQTGICTGSGGVAITSDGGATWDHTVISSSDIFRSAQSLSNGKFRVFVNGPGFSGKIYSTEDRWETIDTLLMVSNPDFIFAAAAFSTGKNIIAFGLDFVNGTFFESGVLARSTTNGETWEEPVVSMSEYVGGIGRFFTVTDPARDTIFAGGGSPTSKLLVSFDKGATWKHDSLPVPMSNITMVVQKLVMMDNGNVLGIYADYKENHHASWLFLGKRSSSSVNDLPTSPLILYPNPASASLTIDLPPATTSFYILDALGRTVKTYDALAAGPYQVDVSSFGPGSYQAVVRSAAGLSSSWFIVVK